MTLRIHLSVSYLFAFSYCSWNSQGKSTELVCHSLLQWTTFCQNSPLWPIHLGWPYIAWLIVSLSYTRLWSMWSVWLVFCDCGFNSVCPLMNKDKRLMEASWWENLTVEETGSCSDGRAMLSKSLIQFSVDGWGCITCLLFGMRSNCQCMPPPETPGYSQAGLAQSLVRTLLLSHGAPKVLFVPSKSPFPQCCGSSGVKSPWPPKSNSLGILSPFARSPGWKVCCGS